MWSMTRSLAAAQRNGSRRVAGSKTFAVRLPGIGSVRVPPPDQLAFYGVLGGLAVLEVLDWPVVLAMGVGSAMLNRHVAEVEAREDTLEAAMAQPKKATPRKAPAKKRAAT